MERDLNGISIGRIEEKCGFRGSNTAEVILEDVVVPGANQIQRMIIGREISKR